MAKFCGNCGTELPDDARICGQCGAPVDGAPKTAGTTYVDPEKKKKTQKRIAIAAGAVAAIVLLIVVIRLIVGSSGPKGMVKKVMKAYEKCDIEALVDMSSDVYLEMGDDYAEDHFDSRVNSDLDYLEDEVGVNYELKYEIVDSYELKERDFKKLVNNFENYYRDYDVDAISAVYAAEIEVTAVKGKRDETIDRVVTLIKERGKWRLLDIAYG